MKKEEQFLYSVLFVFCSLSTHTHKHTHRVGSVKIGCVFARAANELNESVGIPGYQIRIFIKRFL